MGDVMREPQTGQGDRRLSGEWGGGGAVNRADRPSLLAENKTTAGRENMCGAFL